jgi:hypothetical protein
MFSEIADIKSWFSSIDKESLPDPPYYNSLVDKGYSAEDLYSSTHYFLARKK